MISRTRKLLGLAAAAAAIAAVLQFAERDWLRGATGLAAAATLTVIASGLPERSVAGKWLAYALLGSVFILLGMRWFGILSGV